MPVFLSAAEAVTLIPDSSFVLFGGSGGGHAVPEAVIEALSTRYRQTASPRDLTVCSTVSLGDWEQTGFNRLAHKGLVKRVVSAGVNNCPRMAELGLAENIDIYLLPQGVLSQLCRDSAAGRPGLLTRVGLHTFVDPRRGGGLQTGAGGDERVRLMNIDGNEYLFYPALPIDVAVIRGTTADEEGNISMEDEAVFGEMFSMACAAHNRGGTVIAQVNRVAQARTLPGKQVKVPGALVDCVVVDPAQAQTYQLDFDPAYAGHLRVPDSTIAVTAMSIRKAMARRAAMELYPGDIVNLGFGVANDIATVAVEEGFLGDLTLTVEQGLFGGAPAGGKDAGAGRNYAAMVDQPYQFDFYDGGGLDIAFLSFAQVDAEGNVNVSRFGNSIGGPGGFINISQGTRRVVFLGTLTAKSARVHPDGTGGLRIEAEGQVRKWLPAVDQITFNGRYALEQGQQISFITDRAVFDLTSSGLVCTEIARGIDFERDIQAQIGFPVQKADSLREIDPRVYRDEPMKLLTDFHARGTRRARG